MAEGVALPLVDFEGGTQEASRTTLSSSVDRRKDRIREVQFVCLIWSALDIAYRRLDERRKGSEIRPSFGIRRWHFGGSDRHGDMRPKITTADSRGTV